MRRTVLSCGRAAHCPARLPALSAAAAWFEPNGSKPSYAEARQCGFRPLPSIPDFAEYVGVYPRGSAVRTWHCLRVHLPLPIRMRRVGKTAFVTAPQAAFRTATGVAPPSAKPNCASIATTHEKRDKQVLEIGRHCRLVVRDQLHPIQSDRQRVPVRCNSVIHQPRPALEPLDCMIMRSCARVGLFPYSPVRLALSDIPVSPLAAQKRFRLAAGALLIMAAGCHPSASMLRLESCRFILLWCVEIEHSQRKER